MKVRIKPPSGGGGDPTPLTPAQLAVQTLFAKNFGARKGLMSPENLHVGNEGAPFVDEATGKVLPPNAPQPKSNVKLSTYVPPEVTELKEDETGYPYYEHPQTGEAVHVPQNYRYLPRFNPKRGTYDQSIAKK